MAGRGSGRARGCGQDVEPDAQAAGNPDLAIDSS